MPIDSYLKTLKKKHLEFDNLIKASNDNIQDEIAMKRLKKQKLLLKDKINTLEQTI